MPLLWTPLILLASGQVGFGFLFVYALFYSLMKFYFIILIYCVIIAPLCHYCPVPFVLCLSVAYHCLKITELFKKKIDISYAKFRIRWVNFVKHDNICVCSNLL